MTRASWSTFTSAAPSAAAARSAGDDPGWRSPLPSGLSGHGASPELTSLAPGSCQLIPAAGCWRSPATAPTSSIAKLPITPLRRQHLHGQWSIQSKTGYADGGSYTYQPPGNLIATGLLGTAAWRHVGN